MYINSELAFSLGLALESYGGFPKWVPWNLWAPRAHMRQGRNLKTEETLKKLKISPD